MTQLNQSIVLFPLRLTIKKITQPQSYRIRWFPDDIAQKIAPHKLALEELKSIKRFIGIYKNQERALRGLEKSMLVRLTGLPYNAAKADKILKIYYNIVPGTLTSSQNDICQQYTQKALQEILDKYQALLNEYQEIDGIPSDKLDELIVGRRLGYGLYDLENPVLKQAWQELIEEVGLIHARYLIGYWNLYGRIPPVNENLDETQMEKILENGVPIAFMPTTIELFTVHQVCRDARCEDTSLECRDILSENLPSTGSYKFKKLEIVNRMSSESSDLFLNVAKNDASEWHINFDTAVKKGMAVEIKRSSQIQQINCADWLIAVGVQKKEASVSDVQLKEVLESFLSRGKLSLVSQDTPTNNSENSSSGHVTLEEDLSNYLQKTLGRNDLTFNEHWFSPGLQSNEAALSDTTTTDGQRLSHIFQIDSKLLSEIENATIDEQTPVEAMAMLVWRMCTVWSKKLWQNDKTPAIHHQNWNRLEKFFAKYVRARGPFSTLKVGNTPYGILPVVSLENFDVNSSFFTTEEKDILTNIKHFCESIKNELFNLSQSVPTLSRNNSTDSDFKKLLEILRLSSVSTKINFRQWNRDEHGYNDANSLREMNIPLIRDPVEQGSALSGMEYLFSLAEAEVDSAHNTIQNGTYTFIRKKETYSLLHQLLFSYLYLTRDYLEMKSRLSSIQPIVKYLCRLSVKELEILLMEVFDTLCFRLDAWMTALATLRLYECVAQRNVYHNVGVFGWLENPGKISPIEKASEYIQCPSISQATAASIVRSACLDQQNAQTQPFQLDLSSNQVRKGMWYLSNLRQGYSAGEILGYRLEKMIHEIAAQPSTTSINDADIYHLREIYPLALEEERIISDQEKTFLPNLIDGKRFIEDYENNFPILNRNALLRQKRAAFSKLASSLRPISDAAADIAVAESLYQHVQGNTARENAWMEFIEGNVYPPEVEFTNTPRTGEFRESKAYLVLPCTNLNDDSDISIAHPLKLMDPIYYHFTESNLLEWDKFVIQLAVNLKNANGLKLTQINHYPENVDRVIKQLEKETQEKKLTLKVKKDLNILPMQFVLWGLESLTSPINDFLIDLWRKQDKHIREIIKNQQWELLNQLSYEQFSLISNLGPFPHLLFGEAFNSLIAFELNVSDEIKSYLKSATALRRIAANKPAVLSKLSVVLPHHSATLEPDWNAMSQYVMDRLNVLHQKLTSIRLEFDEFFSTVNNWSVENNQLRQYETKIKDLFSQSTAFNISQPYFLPDFTDAFLDSSNPLLADLLASLKQQLSTIIEAMTKRLRSIECQPLSMTGKDESVFNDLKKQLAGCLGIISYQPLIPFCFSAEQTASANFTQSNSDYPDSVWKFDQYCQVRSALEDISNLLHNYKVYCVNFETYNEIYFSSKSTLDNQKEILILSIDQWAEFIPNPDGNETTALAIRIPTPTSQAPNVILIAVPPKLNAGELWDENLLASTLIEALTLMQTRMITSSQIIEHNYLGRFLPLLHIPEFQNPRIFTSITCSQESSLFGDPDLSEPFAFYQQTI